MRACTCLTRCRARARARREREKLKRRAKELAQVDHRSAKYIEFRKNFYIESPEITALSEMEVKALRKGMEDIKVRGQHVPRPITQWTHVGVRDKMYACVLVCARARCSREACERARVCVCSLSVLEKNNYAKPTPIQAQALPAIMGGRDVIGCAKTGSGKTLAFVLPMLRHVLDQPPLRENEGPIGLCMAPTRELAMQIFNELKKFCKIVDLRCVCVYGGAPMKDQIAELKRYARCALVVVMCVCSCASLTLVLCLRCAAARRSSCARRAA